VTKYHFVFCKFVIVERVTHKLFYIHCYSSDLNIGAYLHKQDEFFS